MRKLMLMALMMVATSAAAQQIELTSLDKIAAKAKEKTQINMDASTLKAASGFLDDKKAEEGLAKKTAEGMKGFYLRVFEFEKKGDFKFDDLKPLRDQLKAPDWTVFLQTKEQDEEVEIWMHRTKGEVDGMLLIAAEEQELVVMNVLGLSNPQDLAKIGGQFGIPQIGTKP